MFYRIYKDGMFSFPWFMAVRHFFLEITVIVENSCFTVFFWSSFPFICLVFCGIFSGGCMCERIYK